MTEEEKKVFIDNLDLKVPENILVAYEENIINREEYLALCKLGNVQWRCIGYEKCFNKLK